MANMLSVKDRVALLYVVTPGSEADSVEMVESIRDKVKFKDAEIEKYGLVEDGYSYTIGIEDKKEKKKQFAFSRTEKKCICKRLSLLSDARQMKLAYLPVYKIFVLGEPDAEETSN